MDRRGQKKSADEWADQVVRQDEISRYLKKGEHFINEQHIWEALMRNRHPEPQQVKDILDKSLAIETLNMDETAALLNIDSGDLLEHLFETAGKVKQKVYDNRIVTFAPLYFSNLCVCNCLYCGFRRENQMAKRIKMNQEEIQKEVQALISMGHKRLMLDCGEHPSTDAEAIAEVMETIYKVKSGNGEIRRINLNVASMSIEKLKMLKGAGIGTYQVFQETYHQPTYHFLHREGPKADYNWRLYSLHRAMDAGIDDVGLGALFGLYYWPFEVMGLVVHARELEKCFGVGPHTISIPRLQTAENTPFVHESSNRVSDAKFKRLTTVLRLAVPYTGLILTAREGEHVRREVIPLGITQADAGTRIGIGSYAEESTDQQSNRQQFLLGDTRSLDTFIAWLAGQGCITSFCTAGYRCGRTGKRIMNLLKSGQEGRFCKLNAVLTFKEWLDDYATADTKREGQRILEQEIQEIKDQMPLDYPKLQKYYARISNGERDLFF